MKYRKFRAKFLYVFRAWNPLEIHIYTCMSWITEKNFMGFYSFILIQFAYAF